MSIEPKSQTIISHEYHMIINTTNIHIDLLKTKMKRNRISQMNGQGLVATLGPDKLTTPTSIKSCIAWFRPAQCLGLCP